MKDFKDITEQDIEAYWPRHLTYLWQILVGECSVEESRKDILSLMNHPPETNDDR